LRLGLAAHLNAVENELVVASLWSIFHAAKKPVRRTVAIAAIDRALRNAMPFGYLVVANECLIADNDLLGVGLA
jgi:hypothetical protein